MGKLSVKKLTVTSPGAAQEEGGQRWDLSHCGDQTTADTIEKLIGGNFYRVLGEIWGA